MLLYRGRKAIGWCQIQNVRSLPKLMAEVNVESFYDHHAITCLFLLPEVRSKGIGTAFVSLIANHRIASGNEKLIALPGESGDSAEEIWTGTKRMFLKAGFEQCTENPSVFILCRSNAVEQAAQTDVVSAD